VKSNYNLRSKALTQNQISPRREQQKHTVNILRGLTLNENLRLYIIIIIIIIAMLVTQGLMPV
jgi:hypothetical protein